MKPSRLYLLSILSGLLLAFGWFPHGFILLMFIGFVPLLFVEQTIFHFPDKYKSLTLFYCSYLTFFTWNICTTWWIKNASYGGAAMAIFCNSLLMTIVFLLFHNTKKRLGKKLGGFILICFWITFEFLHLDWDLTYPWLNLGNVFADMPHWIQWYEYTGVFGGSFWILLINLLVFSVAWHLVAPFLSLQQSNEINYKLIKSKLITIFSLLVVPILISFLISQKNIPHFAAAKVVLVQPNIDPYNEKFQSGSEEQLIKMLELAKQKTDTTTDYLLFPETAITEDVWENQLKQSSGIRLVKEFLKSYPKLKIIIGASSARQYDETEAPSATARKFIGSQVYYDAYNTALQLDNTDSIQIYHKSKLVPGVEKMPFPFIFKYFEKFAISLGGTIGSLGTQTERTVFTSPDGKTKTAPVICYESIYGEFVSNYISNGADFISIITNDGWWGDTPGYKQHLEYGRLRAIETRRWIARSANTGITCFITPKGEIQQQTQWWVPAVVSGEIQLNKELTFYTKYGDYIARITMYLSLMILIYSLMVRMKWLNHFQK